MKGSSHPSDGSPAASQLRKRVQRVSAGAGFVGLSGGLIWLGNPLVADITKGATFVFLSVLLFLSAVLFSKRPEPTSRFVRIIVAMRNRRSDH